VFPFGEWASFKKLLLLKLALWNFAFFEFQVYNLHDYKPNSTSRLMLILKKSRTFAKPRMLYDRCENLFAFQSVHPDNFVCCDVGSDETADHREPFSPETVDSCVMAE